MGHRITQRIYTCDICGKTPKNGESMWEMGYEVWCKECCDKIEANTQHKIPFREEDEV